MNFFQRLFYASLLIVLMMTPAWAADDANAADPPGRVARLQYMNGQVSVQPNGTDDWVQGSSNRPLTNADNIWADKDSRAELSLGNGMMRISSEASLTLTNVNNDSVQVSLHQGALNVHVRRLESGEVWEVDTPNLAFTLTKSGDYRFDVDPNGDKTLVTVWKGEGEAAGQGPAVQVRSGEQVQFTGGNSLAHESLGAPKPDGFDEWCRVRDERADHSVSARYVAPGTVGSEDLDEYGTWRQTPDYGAVWVPTSVSPGWAPYSYGHWAWIDPWGWTWVDNYPWGFAPFHYGRWVSWGGNWGWAPGPYWVRPWYAPALVAWWGGPGWGVRFGFGSGFGWCPLGFGEPFFPWYRGSRFYFRNVNISNTRITNIRNITNNYFNNRTGVNPYGRNGIGTPRFASKPGAFTAVSRNTLERGLPVRGSSMRVSPNDLRGANSLSRINATPTREARLGPKANMPAARPQGNAFSRPTVGRMTSPGMSPRTAGSQTGFDRSPGAGARTVGNPVARGSERGAMSSVVPGGHYVPRPPQSMTSGFTNRGAIGGGSRGGPTEMAFNHPIPRPSQGGVRSPAENSARFGSRETPTFSRSVPRPPADFNSRGTASARNTVPSLGSSFGRPRGVPNSVPRPSGRVMPAPRSYGNAENRGGSSTRSYGGGYSASRGYSSPNYGGSYRGYSMPRSGGYSAPSGGSYGGHGGYSAPSHNFGGSGGYHGGPGYHGGSGGSSSHGSGFHGGRR